MNEVQNDQELITRAITGDEAAQRLLYETYYAAAFRLAYLLLQNADDAEEVVQDAFVYVFCNLERHDPERGSFWTWLRVVLVSRCRNRRRCRALTLLPLEALDAIEHVAHLLSASKDANDPANVVDQWSTRQVLWQALDHVSAGAREALILRYYEGLSYAEIAETLGCSQDAARARVSHGKVQLRQLLAAAAERQAEAQPKRSERDERDERMSPGRAYAGSIR
jgi:RNA polymerase sigma-70 factor (ECF subfamily)